MTLNYRMLLLCFMTLLSVQSPAAGDPVDPLELKKDAIQSFSNNELSELVRFMVSDDLISLLRLQIQDNRAVIVLQVPFWF